MPDTTEYSNPIEEPLTPLYSPNEKITDGEFIELSRSEQVKELEALPKELHPVTDTIMTPSVNQSPFIDFLNQINTENPTMADIQTVLNAYKALPTVLPNDSVITRTEVRGYLNQYKVSRTLMNTIANSILVRAEGWQALMLSPVDTDQVIAPYIKGWRNKAMNKVFKRFDLYLAAAYEKHEVNEPALWVFGFKRLNHPDTVIQITRQDDLDYATAAAMAFVTYIRKL
jgi:hypothetical protein